MGGIGYEAKTRVGAEWEGWERRMEERSGVGRRWGGGGGEEIWVGWKWEVLNES